MVRPLLVLLLLPVTVAGGLLLTRAALRRWRDLRSAQAYELAADARPVALRAGGAVLCLLCALALAVAAILSGAGSRDAALLRAASAGDGRSAPPQAAPPGAAAAQGAGSAPDGPAGAAPKFETIGHPAGGELLQASVSGPDGRPRAVRVWLPAQYKEDGRARFPVIVLQSGSARRTADADLPDVFDGLASAVRTGVARPFVVVAPEGPSGTGHPCDLVAAAPTAIPDDAAVRTAVAAGFRTLPAGPGGWGALGIEGGAPCAAAAGLARPDLYGAAAAVSGRYDVQTLAQSGADGPENPAARLLLAAAKSDAEGVAAARGLQSTLHGAPGRAAKANVRISDVAQDFTPQRERLRLVRIAAQYLGESLAKQS